VLAPYGLRGAEETHAIRAWRSLVHGFVSLEMTGGFGLPLDLDESFRRLIRLFIAGLCGEGRGVEPTRPAPSMEEMIPWHARS
nr:WHG domain-containing protein [Chloroflexota bacterium]